MALTAAAIPKRGAVLRSWQLVFFLCHHSLLLWPSSAVWWAVEVSGEASRPWLCALCILCNL
jgi:hypothetical protein